MSDYRPSPEFEELLRRTVSEPNPDPAFVKSLQMRLSGEDIKTSPKNQSWVPRLAWALAAAFLLFIIALAVSSPKVVDAVKRIFGYIPGVGVVEENVAYRVLDETITVTREGITLTVEKVLLSPEQTELVYKFDTIPAPRLMCEGRDSMPGLRLPDDAVLQPIYGGGSKNSESILVLDYVFDPVPADVGQAVLMIPCVLPSGEVWEIPLKFVTLPTDFTPEPLAELSVVTPAAAETDTPSTTSEDSAIMPLNDESLPPQMPLTIEGVIEQDDGIILLCATHPVAGAEDSTIAPFPMQIRFTDASGEEIPFEFVDSSTLLGIDEHIYPWAFKLLTTNLEWPLTTTLDWLGISIEETQATFELETGADPQVGQEWEINQDLQVFGHDIRVLFVRRLAEGYIAFFQAGSEVESLMIALEADEQASSTTGAVVGGGGGGGGGGGEGDGPLSAGVFFDGSIPQGKLTFVIEALHVRIPGPWSMQWSPDDLSSDMPGD